MGPFSALCIHYAWRVTCDDFMIYHELSRIKERLMKDRADYVVNISLTTPFDGLNYCIVAM
jgi:hypothetical protein